MERPFPAYKGDQPYIFVCYSHADTDLVYPELVWLKEQGANLWYDEGIAAGEEWSEELGQAIEGASEFLFFTTPSSVDSRYCRDELRFALDAEKHIVSVHLKETELTSGVRLSIGATQAILKYELPEQEYRNKLLSGLRVRIERKVEEAQSAPPTPANTNNTKPILVAGGLVAVAILAVGLLSYLKPAQESTLTPTEHISEPVGDTQTAAQPESAVVEKEPSIAVLPFVNMSNDPDNEYFSDGISEDILNALVATNTLPVIARTSSFQFKGKNLNVQEIASKLNVTHLVEGSVRKAGNEVRITAQLIDAGTGEQLWSKAFDRELTNIFALQDEIAGKIVDEVGLLLASGPAARQNMPTSRGTANADAYDLYLQAKYLANTGNPFEVEKAIPLYEQALELDPEFADAWVELGQTYIMLQAPPLAHRIPAEVFPIAIEAFKAALEIDPGNSRAMGFLGATLISHEYQWSEGLRLLEQSVALNAGDAEILSTYGINLYFTGHPDASTVLKKAYLLNPIAPSTVYFRAVQLLFDGRWTDAATLMDTQLIQDRERYDTNALAAFFNAYARRFDLAEGYLAKASAVVGADYPFIKRVAYSIARWAGKQVLANEIRDDLLALAKHKRVAYLYPLTDDADLDTFVDAIDLAIDQRHVEIFPHLFADRPERIPESDWDRIQKTIRIAEGKFRAWSHGWVRSEDEIAQLQSAAISLSEDELDFYVGVFEDPAAGQRRSIERDGNQLKSVTGNRRIQLLPMGNHHFEVIDFKYSYDFTVENGRVTQLKWEAFQTSTVFIKKREP